MAGISAGIRHQDLNELASIQWRLTVTQGIKPHAVFRICDIKDADFIPCVFEHFPFRIEMLSAGIRNDIRSIHLCDIRLDIVPGFTGARVS